MKKSLMKEGTRDGVKIFGEIGALVKVLLLLTLNSLTGPWLASLFCLPVRLAERLIQELYQAQDPIAIIIEISLWFFQIG